jgi:maltooligosyltrehalose trehalohydrolase
MPKTYAHDMPFGAQLLPNGETRFRLWAPAQDAVALVLEDPERIVPMTRSDDGFCAVTTAAPAGSRYWFQLEDGVRVPDPASRHQPEDVHGPSEVIDPHAYAWQHAEWCGRPWHEAVLYEVHVGAFSSEGTFDGLRWKLDHIARLGVTGVELMPVADFGGRRNWGYDGVLPFAPDAAYGKPADLKRLIDEAHARGLMVFLDVVYNHFGTDGNYLQKYAESFFEPAEHTPWGPAINYKIRAVRDFVIHNVRYWLEEYRVDGMRLDAVDRIIDRSEVHILSEIAATVRRTLAAGRHVHLVLENDRNDPRWLQRGDDCRPVYYDAQWNDDIHHVYHHLATGETVGYYTDYVHNPQRLLARALSTGFVYQGEPSAHRNGALRGAPSDHLPPTAFVAFIQNHDQIGNRAFGERITNLAPFEAVKALQALVLLAPNIPLLFMGEEWGATQPFCFFTDFRGQLADAVRQGRRREFEHFAAFASEEARARIPDPNDVSTFLASRLDWSVPEQSTHAEWLESVCALLRLRREVIVPRLVGISGGAKATMVSDTAVQVGWTLGDQSRLSVITNLAAEATEVTPELIQAEVLFSWPQNVPGELREGRLPRWSVLWLLSQAAADRRDPPN